MTRSKFSLCNRRVPKNTNTLGFWRGSRVRCRPDQWAPALHAPTGRQPLPNSAVSVQDPPDLNRVHGASPEFDLAHSGLGLFDFLGVFASALPHSNPPRALL